MRSLEPWVEAPLAEFLRESSAHLVLLMTSSGQVIAQHGFTRTVDVMACAALGAAIVASTGELMRSLGADTPGSVVHQGGTRRVLLAAFPMPRGPWVGLIVFGPDTTVGLVQMFFARLAAALHRAAPAPARPVGLLAEQFEDELNASLRSLFGR
jgi:hypothetical protein